jgi:hypothetical protein
MRTLAKHEHSTDHELPRAATSCHELPTSCPRAAHELSMN